MSAAPDWMVEAMRKERRQKCSTSCSAPPKWKTEFSNQELPHGPEVSYGIPFRWSAARLLAADMRAMVCGSRHNRSLQECDEALLNTAEWTPQNFAKKYFSEATSDLLSETMRTTTSDNDNEKQSILQAILDATSSEAEEEAEEMFLWAGKDAPGWVACTQYNNTCHGKISKRDWYDREKRGATCNAVFAEQVLTDFISHFHSLRNKAI